MKVGEDWSGQRLQMLKRTLLFEKRNQGNSSTLVFFYYICSMKVVYIITIQNDGALAVLSAFRNRATAEKFYDEQIQLDVEQGYEIIEDYSQEDISLLHHIALAKDIEDETYDVELWEIDLC